MLEPSATTTAVFLKTMFRNYVHECVVSHACAVHIGILGELKAKVCVLTKRFEYMHILIVLYRYLLGGCQRTSSFSEISSAGGSVVVYLEYRLPNFNCSSTSDFDCLRWVTPAFLLSTEHILCAAAVAATASASAPFQAGWVCESSFPVSFFYPPAHGLKCKNTAQDPTLPRIRYMLCFELPGE